jgi:dTMP kinase
VSLFITFEGIDGCGKSTQVRALYSRLSKSKIVTVRTHEPGGTSLGSKLGEWLRWGQGITPQTELLLFAACRAQLMVEVIRPSLDSGAVVICDRHAESTVAYQGYGRGLDLDIITTLNAIATNGLRPDLIVLLDVAPEVGLARKGLSSNEAKEPSEGDRFEREDLAFHRRVREGYLEIAAAEPQRWVIVNGELPKATVEAAIWSRVKLILETDGRHR